MLAEDGAGRLSARLPRPAGPQAAFSGDPRRGCVTLPPTGTVILPSNLTCHFVLTDYVNDCDDG